MPQLAQVLNHIHSPKAGTLKTVVQAVSLDRWPVQRMDTLYIKITKLPLIHSKNV